MRWVEGSGRGGCGVEGGVWAGLRRWQGRERAPRSEERGGERRVTEGGGGGGEGTLEGGGRGEERGGLSRSSGGDRR